MTLIIDGKAAVLQEKFSFDYVTENPSFSDAEAYTLKITLPLKDCPQNLSIFGHINRKDIHSQDLIYNCEIQDGKFHKIGAITILSINDKEVQVQFLEGKSIANCSETLDDIIINQLDLGYPNTAMSATNYRHWATEDISNGRNYMALPWVNNNSGNIQNDSTSGTGWSSAIERLSFQPYLIYLTKLIFQKIGYTYNFYSWEQSQYKYLLLCNALPAAWGVENWARALPAWSLAEFLEQLELLMNGKFTVDTQRKQVSFTFIHSGGVGNGYKVEKVIDEFSVDIADPSECKYKGAYNLKYASCDHEMWRYYDCPEVVELIKEFESGGVKRYYKEVDTFNDLWSMWSHYSEYPDYKPYTSAGTQYMIYVRDIDTYFVMRLYKTYIQMVEVPGFGEQPSGTWDCYPMPVNQFAHTSEHPDAETKELKIVPAWLDDLPDKKTQLIFLELPDYVGEGGQLHMATQEDLCNAQPVATSMLRDGLPDKENDEFFDKMYVGFYRKEYVFQNKYPIPMLDRFQINLDWEHKTCPYSLRLHDPQNPNYEPMPEIDRTRKYTFKFLADSIPDISALFFIAGNRYLCSKLTVNFTKKGKSQLVKGEFWRVDDSFSHWSSW